MLARVLAAAIVSAVLMFVWGFLFWAVLGMGARVNQPLPADHQLDVLATMRLAGLETGMYVHPFPCDPNDAEGQKEFERKAAEGPRFQLAYVKEGGPAMDPKVMAMGFAHMLLVSFLTATLLALVVGSLPKFADRFTVVFLIAVIVAAWANIGDAIWWMHPMPYAFGNMAYQLGAGALMALAFATIVKRPAGEAGGASCES